MSFLWLYSSVGYSVYFGKSNKLINFFGGWEVDKYYAVLLKKMLISLF